MRRRRRGGGRGARALLTRGSASPPPPQAGRQSVRLRALLDNGQAHHGRDSPLSSSCSRPAVSACVRGSRRLASLCLLAVSPLNY